MQIANREKLFYCYLFQIECFCKLLFHTLFAIFANCRSRSNYWDKSRCHTCGIQTGKQSESWAIFCLSRICKIDENHKNKKFFNWKPRATHGELPHNQTQIPWLTRPKEEHLLSKSRSLSSFDNHEDRKHELLQIRQTYNFAHLKSTKVSLTFEYLENENINFAENKENIWWGNYFFASKKEMVENNWRRKLFFLAHEKEKEGNIWRG